MSSSILWADLMLLLNFFQSGQFLRDLGIKSTPPQLLLVIFLMTSQARDQKEHTVCLSLWSAMCKWVVKLTVINSCDWHSFFFYLIGSSDNSWACWDSSTKPLRLVPTFLCSFNTSGVSWTKKRSKGKCKQTNIFIVISVVYYLNVTYRKHHIRHKLYSGF